MIKGAFAFAPLYRTLQLLLLYENRVVIRIIEPHSGIDVSGSTGCEIRNLLGKFLTILN